MMVRQMIVFAAATTLSVFAFAKDTVSSVFSPDGRNEIRFDRKSISYKVLRDGVLVVADTPVSMKIAGKELSDGAKFKSFVKGSLSGTVGTPVYKKSSINLAANTLFADYGDWGVRLAARNDGVAYRFETKFKDTIRVESETAPLTIPDAKARCWFGQTIAAGCEETIPSASLAGELAIKDGHKAFLPFVYTVGGKYVAVVESDVCDFPIWNLVKGAKLNSGAVRFNSWMAPWPSSTQRIGGWGEHKVEKGGRWIRVTGFDKYLVETQGTRTFPWRGFILADRPAQFVESDLVNALARPRVEGDDFAWVRPGKVAWDWWNCFDNKRIPENNGVNTKTYERFIDFARKTGVEYVILDEGWSESLNIWKFHPSVDVPHIVRYANERGVGIILWMAWAQVAGEEEKVAAHFSKMGVKGFKVDFMDRGDAECERFLWKFAEACRRHRMLVDYHGAHRPTGMSRTYPNVLNYEGVHGLEQMKWGAKDARHYVDCDVKHVFLRMTAGPMDYTPGAMDNYPVDNYLGGYGSNPGSPGTRARQMALMALYEAPLQMLCDAPTKYEKNMESFQFMAATPVVWDDAVGLAGDPDSMAAVARRSRDGSWYVAAITDSTSRNWTLDTSLFLKEGEWAAEIFRDAPSSDAKPCEYVHENKVVKAGEKMSFKFVRGGGCVIKFVRK
jgi:alpha-glucosidase